MAIQQDSSEKDFRNYNPMGSIRKHQSSVYERHILPAGGYFASTVGVDGIINLCLLMGGEGVLWRTT